MWESMPQPHGDFPSSTLSCWGSTTAGVFSSYPFRTTTSASDSPSSAAAFAFGATSDSSHSTTEDNGGTPTSCCSDAAVAAAPSSNATVLSAHGSTEGPSSSTWSIPCKFFASGGCTRGSQCPFQHDLTVSAATEVDATRGFVLTGQVVNLQSHTLMQTAKQQQLRQLVQQPAATTPASSNSCGLNPGAAPFSLSNVHADTYRCNPENQLDHHAVPLHSSVPPQATFTYDDASHHHHHHHQPQPYDYYYGDEEPNEDDNGGAYGYVEDKAQESHYHHPQEYYHHHVTMSTSASVAAFRTGSAMSFAARDGMATDAYGYPVTTNYGSSFESTAAEDYRESTATSTYPHDNVSSNNPRWRPSGVFAQHQPQLSYDVSFPSGRRLQGQADLAALSQQYGTTSSSSAWYEQRRQQALRPPLQTSKGSSTSSQASLSEEDVADRAVAAVTTAAAARQQPSTMGMHAGKAIVSIRR